MAIIKGMLEAERDNCLSCQRYKRSETTNSRDGYSQEMVRSSQGEMKIEIPREKEGQFQPELIKKHQSNMSQFPMK